MCITVWLKIILIVCLTNIKEVNAMKSEYESAYLEMVAFVPEDVVVTSGGGNGNETEEGDP